MPLQITQLHHPAELINIKDEWNAVANQMPYRTPFASWLWNMTWWDLLRRNDGPKRDNFFVHTIRAQSGELIAIAPLMLTERRIGPLTVRRVHFFGEDAFRANKPVTEIRCLVCVPERQSEVLDALISHFRVRNREWDVLALDGLPKSNVTNTQRGSVKEQNVQQVVFVNLLRNWDDVLNEIGKKIPKRERKTSYSPYEVYLWTLSTKARRDIRQSIDALNERTLEHGVRVIDNPDDTEAALKRLFKMSDARANTSKMNTVHTDLFSHPINRAFFHTYVHEMAKLDQLRIFEYRVGGETVASRLGFLFNGQLYLGDSGMNPDWAKHNVGVSLMAGALKWAFAHNMTSVNFGVGVSRAQTRWEPESIHYAGVIMDSGTSRGRLISYGMRTKRGAKAAANTLLDHFKALGNRTLPYRTKVSETLEDRNWGQCRTGTRSPELSLK
jgi:predicted N-acyltransferase